MESRKKVVVACGGTGGHDFPGLAVANVLKERGHDVTVWLSGRDIESATLKEWDGPTFSTGAVRLSLHNLPGILRSISTCKREITQAQPDALLAMGSYSSLPPVLAARCKKVPILLHEANAIPGKAIDFLSRFATAVAYSFKETPKWLPSIQTFWTGLPVRTSLAGQSPFDDIPKDVFTFFVTGGSQGAHRVNEILSQAFCLLREDLPDLPLYVIHQTGKADEGWVKALYMEHHVQAKVSAFITVMGRAFASGDFVVARAGASTCFELCLVEKPALLIPLPSALRNHQHYNARALAGIGAVDDGIQVELTGRSVMRYLRNCMEHPTRLKHMSLALREVARPQAADCVADALIEIAGRR